MPTAPGRWTGSLDPISRRTHADLARYGTEWFGKNEWYPEGANFLLGAQQPGGAWNATGRENGVINTCFAILFLRRATRPLTDVASVDPLKAPK